MAFSPQNIQSCENGDETSVKDLEENLISSHFNPMCCDRLNGRHAKGFAGPNIKPSSVAGALDLDALEFAFRERPTIVSANVIDRIERTADIEEGDGSSVEFEQSFFPRGHLRAVGHLQWSWHEWSVLS
jgi:hypothetical protein